MVALAPKSAGKPRFDITVGARQGSYKKKEEGGPQKRALRETTLIARAAAASRMYVNTTAFTSFAFGYFYSAPPRHSFACSHLGVSGAPPPGRRPLPAA